MKFCKRTFFAAMFLGVVTTAHAQRDVLTYSAAECGQYLDDRRKNAFTDHHAFYVWGVLSGYNAYSSSRQVSGDLPATTVHAYLEKYCRDNPLSTTASGAIALIREKTGAVVPLRK